MSQPQLTSFFGNTKRGAKVAGKAKVASPAPRRSSRATKGEEVVEKLVVLEQRKVNIEKPVKQTVEKDDEANEIIKKPDKENKEEKADCPSPVKRPRRTSRSQKSGEEVEELEEVKKKVPVRKRTTKAMAEEDEAPASPSKRAKRGRSKAVEEAVAVARGLAGEVEQGKLTPGQVKEQLKGLKGRNKLAVLRQQLQAIQEAAKTKEDLEEEVRKAEEAKAKVAKKEAIAATPAHQKFHSLAAKEDSGLPLPYTYSFLQEVFRWVGELVLVVTAVMARLMVVFVSPHDFGPLIMIVMTLR